MSSIKKRLDSCRDHSRVSRSSRDPIAATQLPCLTPSPLSCCQQVNKKTRTSAYQLLVDIAHELDDARPLSVDGADLADSDDEMDTGGGGELSGGLIDFVNAVMAGLVGSSPHMQVCGGLQPGACWAIKALCHCVFIGCVSALLTDDTDTGLCVLCAVCCRAGPVPPGV